MRSGKKAGDFRPAKKEIQGQRGAKAGTVNEKDKQWERLPRWVERERNLFGDYMQIEKKEAWEEGAEIKERGNRMLRRGLLDGASSHNELIDPSNWANLWAGTGHHALENRSDREQGRGRTKETEGSGEHLQARGGCHEKVELFRV